MANHRISLLASLHDAVPRKPAVPVRLPQTVQNDVSLNALLEEPIAKHTRRSPLEWAGAMAFHIVIIAALIIVPLYTTGTISFNEYDTTPLVAPPPAPPAPAAAAPVAPHAVRPKAKVTYSTRKFVAPTAIPRKVSSDTVADAAPPDVAGVAGGVPGGVAGGQIGGGLGGTLGGTGAAVPPPPPPPPQPRPKILRVGSNLKAPRQTFSVDPDYPPLARQTHQSGTVSVDAVIDEKGNVVQARVISGPPLFVAAALRAVLQWKYEPTYLNGQPISVELQVQVHFNLQSNN